MTRLFCFSLVVALVVQDPQADAIKQDLLTAARPKNPIILWSTLKIHE
jgi:hypothetical protein